MMFLLKNESLRIRIGVSVLGLVLALSSDGWAKRKKGEVSMRKEEGKIVVELDGKPFTEYIYEGMAKPILYPIIGPYGIPMTRNFPMKKDVAGEAYDHPHHRSFWYTHGDVNGVDFWAEGDGRGQTVQKELVKAEVEDGVGIIQTKNDWVGPDGKVQMKDERILHFGQDGEDKIVDFEITLHALEKDVVLGDTKEGTMGIRTHPKLRLRGDAKRGVESNGKAVNSEGVEGPFIWGKRANWVDYWGEIDGKVVGVAIFDHPTNPRHPTWWHARDYGLVAANPFGLHDFERKPEGEGNMTIEAGKSVTFKYRFIFHAGDVEKAKIAERYDAFAGGQ